MKKVIVKNKSEATLVLDGGPVVKGLEEKLVDADIMLRPSNKRLLGKYIQILEATMPVATVPEPLKEAPKVAAPVVPAVPDVEAVVEPDPLEADILAAMEASIKEEPAVKEDVKEDVPEVKKKRNRKK